LSPTDRLKWLSYPHSLLNKVKNEEELKEIHYISSIDSRIGLEEEEDDGNKYFFKENIFFL
jgi:hypothetical protein